jgi:hypothetical protein
VRGRFALRSADMPVFAVWQNVAPLCAGEIVIGVEYFVAAADQEPPIDDSDTPHLFGRSFDGPMEDQRPIRSDG